MNKCKEYLQKAKENQWTISKDDLMIRFNLSVKEVDECIAEVYN